jgi:putative transposase
MNTKRHDYLKRLPPENYCGRAYVHWSLTMEDRKTGWLIPIFYYKYREILTHTTFRLGVTGFPPVGLGG